jgi:DNA-binding NtrC family response regulator
MKVEFLRTIRIISASEQNILLEVSADLPAANSDCAKVAAKIHEASSHKHIFCTVDCEVFQGNWSYYKIPNATIFLKNISALKSEHQKTLYTAIEAGNFQSSRLVSSSALKLSDLVRDGIFDQELCKKLSEIKLMVDKDALLSRYSVEIGKKQLDHIENELIAATLDYCGGNKEETARLLGIHVRTVYRRLEA